MKAYVVIIYSVTETDQYEPEFEGIDSVHKNQKSAEARQSEINKGINLSEKLRFTYDWVQKHKNSPYCQDFVFFADIKEYTICE